MSKRHESKSKLSKARQPAIQRRKFDAALLLKAAVLLAAALWIYWPSLHGEWLWDDDLLITKNFDLRTWAGLERIWFAAPSTDYWPVTWTTLWMEWHLWGGDSFGYHLVSLSLHITSGFFIWHILGRLGLRFAWLGGLLFVVHPLAVESVAWAAEIKNTLSLPFYLLALEAWLDHEEGQGGAYWRSLAFYLIAMLAKTSTVMLPVVLLLYCWWKRDKIALREIKQTLPFFAVALILGIVTILCQGQMIAGREAGLGTPLSRLITAGTGVFFYWDKFIAPIELLPIYPRWTFSRPTAAELLTLPALGALLAVLWSQHRPWSRTVLFGLGFFLVNLFPVLGLFRQAYSSVSWVADHFAYLPMIGLVGIAVAGLELAYQRASPSMRLTEATAISLAIVVLSWLSNSYSKVFVNQATLWRYTLEHNSGAPIAHEHYGLVLAQNHRMAEAKSEFEAALAIDPDFAQAHVDLGNVLAQEGQVEKEIEEYRTALKIVSRFSDAHYNLGEALLEEGNTEEAMKEFRAALDVDPHHFEAFDSLANCLLKRGELDEAIRQYENSLQINPDNAKAHNNMGIALAMKGRFDQAVAQFQESLRLDPEYPGAKENLARAQSLFEQERK